MHSNTTTGVQSLFYWKVPVSEKDYKLENVQRIRTINAQNKQNREPMKAAFVPGVTRNPKYKHVTSRVGEFLRGNTILDRGGGRDDGSNGLYRSKLQTSSSANKLSGPGSMTGNRRLSRSSSDLATINKKKPLSNSASAVGATAHAMSTSQSQLQSQQMMNRNIGVDGPGNYVPRAKRKPPGLQPQDESVYNWRQWRFNDQVAPTYHNVPPDISHSEKLYHRVEY